VTEWTSLWPVTPASHFPQPESDSAQKILATSGLTSPDQYELFDLDYASLRMSKDTSALDSEKSLESWNQSVTRRRGEYSARLKSAHRTSASGSLSWPTTNARDWKDSVNSVPPSVGQTRGHSLGMAVAEKNWPTIRASEYKDVGPVGSKCHDHMLGKHYLCAVVTQEAANWLTPQSGDVTGSTQEAVVMWANGQRPKTSDQRLRTQVAAEQLRHGQAAPANPSTHGSRQGLWVDWRTPGASDGEGGVMEMREGCAGKYKLRDHAADGNKSAKLNPRWVETLMGLPIGWVMPSCASPVTIELTNCASSATESCQQQQNELFAF